MRFTSTLFLFVALCGFAQSSHAWGATGHMIICQLAYDQLSDDGKKFVADTLALGTELDGNGKNEFAEACLWPDSSRFSDYKGTYEQHFINIPAASDSIDFARDCAAMDCIAVGIQRNLTYLSKPAGGKREEARKAAALRFLGHFIGDLHQPLHVSNGEDWGGNKIQVSFFEENTNLHSVWDTKIVDRAGLKYPDSLPFLRSVEVHLGSRNVLSWMRESFKLARSHAYPNVSGTAIKTGDILDDAYFERSKPIVIERIALSAHRLAYLIEALTEGSIETNILME